MNSKHQKTLQAVFGEPVNGNLGGALRVAVGCRILDGAESSVTFEQGGARACFHRPHPQKERGAALPGEGRASVP
jgi:hypothetical protein